MIELDVLDSITIPVACPTLWDEMHGTHRTRFCDKCRQNVHDVSELSRSEAVELLNSAAETPCLRIYRRQDGRVLTSDCTTKRERVWKWLDTRSPWTAWLFALAFMSGCDSHLTCTTGEPPYHEPTITEQAEIAIADGATTISSSSTKNDNEP